MRTTLDVEEDVLLAARELARRRGISVGKALSDLARQALTRQPTVATRDGLPVVPVQPQAGVVTLEFVNRLRDEAS